jgi:hypothetical protein
MRAPIALLLAWGFFSSVALAQHTPVLALQHRAGPAPDEVLNESYQVSRELAPLDRAILLNFISRTAGQHHNMYTSAWAQENFLLANQLPLDWNRIAIEKNAAVAMSFVAPLRAMVMLRSMDLPVSAGNGFPEDVRSDAATTIFLNYWRANRQKGLGRIRADALYLGYTGQYPYHAVAGIVTELADTSLKQSRAFPDAAQSLVFDAFASYQHGSKFRTENDEFVEFLQSLHSVLPSALLRQGLELAVERLVNGEGSSEKEAYLARVETDRGTVTFHRREDKLLFDLLPLLREINPQWPSDILRRDPSLQQPQGNGGHEVAAEAITIPGGTEPPTEDNLGLQESRAQAAGELARTDPDRALQLV